MAAARPVSLLNLFIAFLGTVGMCAQARAEPYEIPIPVTGEYMVRAGRDFVIDLGFPLAEVRDVRFRVEGTMVAPLEEPLGGSAGPHPVDGRFAASLTTDSSRTLTLLGPLAGLDTYPESEPFAAITAPLGGSDWTFLLDGRVEGRVVMRAHGTATEDDIEYGGTGVISYASIIIDATPVPEPRLSVLVLALAVLLLRRHAPAR